MFYKIFISASALIAAFMFGSPVIWAQSGQEQSPGPGGSEQQRGGAEQQGAEQRSGEAGQQGQAGMEQEEVKKVQEALKEKGHDPGPVDGIFGPQTREALRQYQSAEGIEATGELNEETKKKLGIEESGGLFQREPKSGSSGGREGGAQQQEGSQSSGR